MRECERCGEAFSPSRSTQKYCSRRCADCAKAEAYRTRHRERVLAQKRASAAKWRAAHPEESRARSKSYREANPETARAAVRRWHKANPLRKASYETKRRALKQGVPSDGLVVDLTDRCCAYCGAPAAHVDHVVPLARGGHDTLANKVPACMTCNTSKGAKDPEVWMGVYLPYGR
jgi:5-methylcytosine-specific restriction endonuclease McrA